MRELILKKGLRLNLSGAPSPDVEQLPDPDRLAVLPHRIPFVAPKLAVGQGDSVMIGSVLFTDKHTPRLQFVSPGAGTVSEIRYGPRRVVERIVIDRSMAERHRPLTAVDHRRLGELHRDQLVSVLLDGGLWPLLRSLPLRGIADPDAPPPPAVIVSLTDRDPFQPAAAVYLTERLPLFDFGLQALALLSGSQPLVAAAADEPAVLEMLGGRVTHKVRGAYPAGDPGLVLYQTKTSAALNQSWFISGQDLLILARGLNSGRFPTRRIVALAGIAPEDRRRHYSVRWGAPLRQLVGFDAPSAATRLVAGGLLRGYRQQPDDYLGYYESGVMMLPEGDRREFLALFNPGWRKPSLSRAYLSRWNPGPLDQDCNRHGGVRACIACMHCADACPVDILPQMAYKAILADELEEVLAHGLMDCLECGLCSWVCPAKIELTETLKGARMDYWRQR